MSAFRRLTSSLRSERRCEQACPYSRPQPSPPKPKPTRRPRYWDFFNFFSFAAPYTDEEEEEAKKQAEAKAKASQQNETIVVSEQDSEMSDASVSASSTEESTTTTSDSSVETVETAVTSERAEPVEVAKPSELVQFTRTAESTETAERMRPSEAVESAMPVDPSIPSQSSAPTNAVSSQPPVSSIPPPNRSFNQVPVTDIGQQCSQSEPPAFSSDDEVLEWVKRKVELREGMNNTDFLGIKSFIENSRKNLTYQPIKLRFVPRHSSPPTTSQTDPDAAVSRPSTCDTTTSSGAHDLSTEEPSYYSAFHSSTGLPTFKNNIPTRPKKTLSRPPIKSVSSTNSSRTSEESRKRPAPLVKLRFDPYKRRRLFGEANGPLATPDVGSSQSGNASGSVSSIPPRLPHVGVNHRHVAPHAPSPLRNVISESPMSPPRQKRAIPTNLSATSSRSAFTDQTASAAYLQEAIEKVMPRRPRYSDVINPYQSAAPVKPVIKPMEKKRMSERRARSKEIEKQKEAANVKEVEKRELSAKEIIEATVPKGAKRSRPPPGFSKLKSGNSATPGVIRKRVLEEPEDEPAQTKKRRTVTVEEVAEEDDIGSRSFPSRPNVIIESRSPSPEPTSARLRPPVESLRTREPPSKVPSAKAAAQAIPASQANVKEAPVKASPTKESSVRVKEQTAKTLSSSKVSSSKESSARNSTKSSSPKGPSNHFSPLLNSKVTGKSSVPREPSKLRTSFLPDECENEEPKMASPTPSATVTMTTPGTPLADIQEKKDPKEVALTLPLNDLPSFIFKTPPAFIAGDHTDARVAAKEIPVTSLPKFDFSKARTAMNGVIFPAVPIPTIKPFDFESVGVVPIAASRDGQWQCPTCMLQNSASAVQKCSICEAPRPGAQKPKKLAVNGINGVNGVKTPVRVAGKNASPKSSSISTNSPTVKTFDFAAAGLTPKAPVADGQWTCSTCMLQNPATAIEKCIVCDSPRPGAEKTEKVEKPKKPYVNGSAHSSKNLSNGVASATVKSFDYTAAGLAPKAPSTCSSWHCSTCMLQNPATALEKCKVCDSARPGTEKKATRQSVVPVKPIPQLVPKSFDWAGAGMVPKFKGSSWTCGTCMLSNPPTETEKCKVCDASRS
ncbi:hypothetical protein ACEPAG_4606 [Sanghuangporus baumii]